MNRTFACAIWIVTLSAGILFAEEEGFVSLFNGKDLSGWVNANCAPDTWSVKDGLIHCTGFPTGAMRTEKQYENYILELEWRHLSSGGNSGVFIWGTPISAPGVPFLRGVEVQVLDHGYNAKGKNEWFTTNGDVFPINGTTLKPFGRHNGMRSFPSEERSKGTPEWNHYRVVCENGTVRLHVNGKEVSGGEECNYRKGYLALESEGAPVEFKNIRIKELPTSNPLPEHIQPLDQGFRCLYTGVDLRGWREPEAAAKRWQPSDWKLAQKPAADAARHNLLTEAEYGDAEFIIDLRVTAKLSADTKAGVLIRGFAVTLADDKTEVTPKPVRSRIQIKGRQVTLWQNDKELRTLELPENTPAKGALGLIDCGGQIEFGNMYARGL
jgi:hypothetical protein